MSNNIQDKVIVITGASSGMGEAAARHLAQQGAKVVLGARRIERLDALVSEITSAGGEALAQATDVTRLEDVQARRETGVPVWGKFMSQAGAFHSGRWLLTSAAAPTRLL